MKVSDVVLSVLIILFSVNLMDGKHFMFTLGEERREQDNIRILLIMIVCN